MEQGSVGWAVRREGDGRIVWIGDQRAVFKAHGETGNVGLFELEVPQGSAVPIHMHPKQDETHYIIEGEFEFLVEDDRFEAGPGSIVFVRRLVSHAFRNTSGKAAKLLVVESPAGPLEEFLLRIGTEKQMPPAPPDMEMLMRVAKETEGIDILASPDAW